MITAEMLLDAYTAGYFPMAESHDSLALYWLNPEMRCVLFPDAFHLSRSMKRFCRRSKWRITVDQTFEEVIISCATMRSATREDSWINEEIIALYTELHEMGHAHSVEVWEDSPTGKERLVGGLYGVSIGGAFFGESMFSRKSNASKLALAHLVARLKLAGYALLDAQFENPHLDQFGFSALPQADYLMHLRKAINAEANPSSRFAVVSVPSASLSGA